MTLTEENGFYAIDCSQSLWATDEHHEKYNRLTVSLLTDADWLIETSDELLIIEYKNGNTPNQTKSFNPNKDEYIRKVARKFYDTLHYLTIINKTKPKKYYYVLEYPKSDSVTNKIIREKIAKLLPFRLQDSMDTGISIIDSFNVLSIKEWNESFPDFPIRKLNN